MKMKKKREKVRGGMCTMNGSYCEKKKKVRGGGGGVRVDVNGEVKPL